MTRRIVIATPHRRFDEQEARLNQDSRLDVLRIRDPQELSVDTLASFDPAYVFFPHWSWKIPEEIFQRFTCVIFHMTDVPFGRGGSPLQNLIARGFGETKLSALRCVAEMDAGPVFLKRPLSLFGTAEEILMRAGDLCAEMIVEIALTNPQSQPQDGEAVTFRRRKPADGDIANAESLAGLFDLIRMLDADGYPRAFADIGPFRLEFDRASLRPDTILADVRIRLRKED